MTLVQLAIARADVALDAAILQDVPIAPRFALDGLIHVALGLSFRNMSEMVIRRKPRQDASGLTRCRTRPPAVAGLFYPSDPDLLRTQVLDLLADDAASSNVMPKALIAPHAGYAYSGRVAAAAFATLRDSAQTITRVVLIGPAHYVHVRGIAAPTVDAFETPLGRVPIDVEALRKIGRPAICHSRPTLRMRPSTLSKWSCRSCKLSWHPSKWCRSSSGMLPRRTSPMCCASCGVGRRR